METCGSCQKAYAAPRGLAKHLARQPLCARWASLLAGEGGERAIGCFVDARFGLPRSEGELELGRNTCGICGTAFANSGNLNRHLKASLACAKWAMYRELEPLGGCVDSTRAVCTAYRSGPVTADEVINTVDDGGVCIGDSVGTHPFAPPSSKPAPIFVIWSLFLAEKDLELSAELLSDNNIRFVIAILPSADIYGERVKVEVDHHVMVYDGHTPAIDFAKYRSLCLKIDAVRQAATGRGNTLVYCNTGYQRSLPFLVYYLHEYHRNEAPSIKKAMEIVLGATDRSWIMNRDQFDEAVLRVESLLAPGLSDYTVEAST